MKIPVVLVLLWTGVAQAAGFAVDVHSARAVGMAQTMKAHIDDASAVFFNPAGLIMGRQLDIQVGDTLIIPGLSFKSAAGASYTTQKEVVPPPHIYAAYALNDDISLGLGMFSLFGLVVPWAPDWPGKYQAVRTELKTYFINPEVAGLRSSAALPSSTVHCCSPASRMAGSRWAVEVGGSAETEE